MRTVKAIRVEGCANFFFFGTVGFDVFGADDIAVVFSKGGAGSFLGIEESERVTL